MGKDTFELDLLSDPKLLPELESFIQKILKQLRIEKDKRTGILLAVAEGSTNAMMHGNKWDKTKKIKVTVKLEPARITIKIKDEGKGFNPSDVPDPTAPENILKDSGRGLFIMNTYVDSVDYNFTPEGTELIISTKF